MTVTFFGHSDTPESIEENLKEIIINIIENYNAHNFYVGDKGNFDALVRKVLKNLTYKYPTIKYAVVLSRYPVVKSENYDYTVYPEEIAEAPKRFAIDRRNMWMVKKSDIVITYVKRNIGGAAKFKTIAEKSGKKVINIE